MASTPELHSNVTDTALIFEGGGMRAALTSAVVATLLKQGIYFDWVAGVSAGTSNSVNYVARDAARARKSFVEFAADPNFGSVRTFLRGQGLFNAEYIYEQTSLPDQALPFDWQTFIANPADLHISAFNGTTGQAVVWSKKDLHEMRDLMVRVRASSTMPLLMPPVNIDGNLYVDGALNSHGGIALSVAQEAGFGKFFVVLTQERDYVKPAEKRPGLFRRHFRKMPAVAEAVIARPDRYNATREELFELERQGKAYLFVPETMPVSNGEKSVAKLAAAHELGLIQARKELPAWREFLNLA